MVNKEHSFISDAKKHITSANGILKLKMSSAEKNDFTVAYFQKFVKRNMEDWDKKYKEGVAKEYAEAKRNMESLLDL